MPDRRFTLHVAHFVTVCALAALATLPASSATATTLQISVYATAGDVLKHLTDHRARSQTLAMLRQLDVTRVFLEGRRGDEYVPPATLRETRRWLESHEIDVAGGIATVPGETFGVRQSGGLGWLNWEADKTRQQIAVFFTENAPVFDTLIVDDFYCTGDTSPASERARGSRPWGEYRRDLLVSLMEPLIFQPARAAHPGIHLILKFPQWYDRFHLFGYDPPRMAEPFDSIWVGTEVRNPETRRMGFVPPTEGYINFRWLASVAGPKVRGAWFDHIECSAQNFVDQAFQSVLAGARELTLFRLGDLMDGHPGDAALAERLPVLRQLTHRLADANRSGIGFYKPAGSDADENLYLMEYLAVVGLPILPRSSYPSADPVVVLARQAADDPRVLAKARAHLRRGATIVMTPAFLRATDPRAAEWAGVVISETAQPAETSEIRVEGRPVSLEVPLQFDAGLRALDPDTVKASSEKDGSTCPWLVTRRLGRGHVVVLNVRTFSEQDFRDAGEWLLAPKPRGLASIPARLADALRHTMLSPLNVAFQAPSGVALYLSDAGQCVYNFLDRPVTADLNGTRMVLPPHGWQWISADASTLDAGHPPRY